MISQARLIDAIDARFGWQPPKVLGVAVSGGSDSLALLHLLKAWGKSKIVVATVDHGLRAEATDEAAFVSRVCETLDLRHDTLRWSDWTGQGNVQDAARRARYTLLARWGRKRGAEFVALGHTEDDVAETFLMRLKRAAGLDGLAAMRDTFSVEEQKFVRPLMGASRADLRFLLEDIGQAWVEDPSNADARFDRVKMRQGFEALKEIGLDQATLAGAALRLRDEKTALSMAAFHRAEMVAEIEAGDIVFKRRRLLLSGERMVDRLISAALRWVASRGYAPRASALAQLTRQLDAPGQCLTLHGCRIDVSEDHVRIGREFNAVWDHVARFDQIWDGRWRITGPGALGDELRALGETGLLAVADWRASGLPRAALLATPAVWRGGELVAAPLLEPESPFKAELKSSFFASLLDDETTRL
ncbi:MAG: tRNA lysidine(34) synthetase TilS [Pseudomonadota bacterium]